MLAFKTWIFVQNFIQQLYNNKVIKYILYHCEFGVDIIGKVLEKYEWTKLTTINYTVQSNKKSQGTDDASGDDPTKQTTVYNGA